MKPLLPALGLALLACSCANNNAADTMVKSAKATEGAKTEKVKTALPATEAAIPEVVQGVEGFYTGIFHKPEYASEGDFNEQITFVIERMDADQVNGYTVFAGNKRPFKGNYKKEGEMWQITASEPGDLKTDGAFDFGIIGKTLKGTWEGPKAKTRRIFNLKAKSWKYDASLDLPKSLNGSILAGSWKNEAAEMVTEDALKKNASSQLLSSKDVENLYLADLEVLRNSIYARHGFAFKSARMRSVFESVPWYMPVATNVDPYLTETEKKNIELIRRYEKHAEKYYEVFGR